VNWRKGLLAAAVACPLAVLGCRSWRVRLEARARDILFAVRLRDICYSLQKTGRQFWLHMACAALRLSRGRIDHGGLRLSENGDW
jgi:hypothetical protein